MHILIEVNAVDSDEIWLYFYKLAIYEIQI